MPASEYDDLYDYLSNHTAEVKTSPTGVIETVTPPAAPDLGAAQQPMNVASPVAAPVPTAAPRRPDLYDYLSDPDGVEATWAAMAAPPVQPEDLQSVIPAMPQVVEPEATPEATERKFLQEFPFAFKQRKEGLRLEQRLGFSKSVEEREAMLMEYRKYQREYQDIGGNWFVGAAAMLPDMLQGFGGRLAGTVAGGTLGAAATAGLNLIPGLALTPEEVVTAPALIGGLSALGAKIGGIGGGMAPMYMQGKGQLYADMREAGILDETANTISAIGAGPYAAIEFLNQYIKVPGFKGATTVAKKQLQQVLIEAVQKQMKKGLGRTAGSIAGRGLVQGTMESSEEFFQEVNNSLWANLAATIEKNESASKPTKVILLQALEAFKMAFGPSLVLGGPGAVYQGSKEARTELNEEAKVDDLVKSGFTPEQAAEVYTAKTITEQLEIKDRIEREEWSEQNNEAPAEVRPEDGQGAATEEGAGGASSSREVPPDQSVADQYAETLRNSGRPVEPGAITAVEAPQTIEREATEAAAELFGFDKVVWVENKSDHPFQAGLEGRTLIVDSGVSGVGVKAALHEAIESVRESRPDDFVTLKALVEATADKMAVANRKARTKVSAEKLGEDNSTELAIQVLQEFAADPVFWAELQTASFKDEKTRTAFERVVKHIIEFIDTFVAKLTAINPSSVGADRVKQYFSDSDLTKVRSELVALLGKDQGEAVKRKSKLSKYEQQGKDFQTGVNRDSNGNKFDPNQAENVRQALKENVSQEASDQFWKGWKDAETKEVNKRVAAKLAEAEAKAKKAEAEARAKKAKAENLPVPTDETPVDSEYSTAAAQLIEDFDNGDNGVDTIIDLVDELEGLPDLPEAVQTAVDVYRAEEVEDRLEHGLRGDSEAYEGALYDAVKASINLQTPEEQATTKPPTKPPTDPEGSASFTGWEANATPPQIRDMSPAELRSLAQNAKYPDGTSVRALMPGRFNAADARVALTAHRKAYMEATGKKERKSERDPDFQARIAAQAEEKKYEEQQESAIRADLEAGSITVAEAAETAGISDSFKDELASYGKSAESPRAITDNIRGYRDKKRVYAIGKDGVSYRITKKDQPALYNEFVSRENGNSEMSFMAKEAEAIESGDYRGVHRAPTGEHGEGSLDAMERTYPDDLYGEMGWRYYGDGSDHTIDKKIHRTIRRLQGKPDETVTVYRAVPKGVEAEIEPGDWVTPSLEYAQLHGRRWDEGMTVLSREVRARELFTEGNSLYEYGWSGKALDLPEAARVDQLASVILEASDELPYTDYVPSSISLELALRRLIREHMLNDEDVQPVRALLSNKGVRRALIHYWQDQSPENTQALRDVVLGEARKVLGSVTFMAKEQEAKPNASRRAIQLQDLPESMTAAHVATSLAALKKTPGYKEAKKEADVTAALAVVKRHAKKWDMDKLREAGVDMVVPADTLEAGKKNAIPYAMAVYVQDELSVPFAVAAVTQKDASNTGVGVTHRLGNKIVYKVEGKVKGKNVAIVDDNFTSGETVLAVAEAIIAQGGNPVIVMTLANSQAGRGLKPTDYQVQFLLDALEVTNVQFQHEFGYSPYQFTGAEIQRLARLNPAKDKAASIRKRLGVIPEDDGAVPESRQTEPVDSLLNDAKSANVTFMAQKIPPMSAFEEENADFFDYDPNTQVIVRLGRKTPTLVPRYAYHQPPHREGVISRREKTQDLLAHKARPQAGVLRAIEEAFGEKNPDILWLGSIKDPTDERIHNRGAGTSIIDLRLLDDPSKTVRHTGQGEGNIWHSGNIPAKAIIGVVDANGEIANPDTRFMAKETAQRDVEYAKAVKTKNTARQQQLVDQAAASSMKGLRLQNAGTPEHMFHGSLHNDSSIFALDKTPHGDPIAPNRIGRGIDKLGFWFTSSKGQAAAYGKDITNKRQGRIFDVYIDIKNPLEFQNKDDFNAWLEQYALHHGADEQFVKDTSGTVQRPPLGAFSAEAVRDRLRIGGKDGIIIWRSDIDGRFGLEDGEGSPAWAVALDSNQIKSADPITRADAGNVIPLSERFDSAKNDIRFMAKEEDVLADDAAPKRKITVADQSKNAGNKHGFMPHLRVTTKYPGNGKKNALVPQATMNTTAERLLGTIDTVLKKHPQAARSVSAWKKMMSMAMNSDDVPVPPYKLIRNIRTGGDIQMLKALTDGQIRDADHGFRNAAEFRKKYTSGEVSVQHTAKLFLWSFLSRGITPYAQEAMFIDTFKGIDTFINDTTEGTFDLDEYLAWADKQAPKGSGLPGAGAKSNLNSFGEDFLTKMAIDSGDGRSRLQKLHDMMADPESTGRSIRREFSKFGEGVGIDNKVVSFTLLVAGYGDIMVLDRVQFKQLWDDGRFKQTVWNKDKGKWERGSLNLYDGYKEENADGKSAVVQGSSLGSLGDGVRGIMVYEAIEDTIAARLEEIYGAVGRPQDATLGRYHWDTWVAASTQEASHGSLDAILKEVNGLPTPLVGATAKEGKFTTFAYGARYGRDGDGQPYFLYEVPGHGSYKLSVDSFVTLLKEAKLRKNGVVPSKFKVSKEFGEAPAPWYDHPEVNKSALNELANKYGKEIDDGNAIRQDNATDVTDASIPNRPSANRPQAGGEAQAQSRSSQAQIAPSLLASQRSSRSWDTSFMAKEDDMEQELHDVSQKKTGFRKPIGKDLPDLAPGYPKALKALQTTANSELAHPEIVRRISARLKGDPEAYQSGYSMQDLMDNTRAWIDGQGSLADAYNAIGTPDYNELAPNEQIGVLVTLQQYLAASAYQTGNEGFFDLAEQLHLRAAKAGMEYGRAVKAFDAWRELAPNNVAEAEMFARRLVKEGITKAFEVKGRDDVMGISRNSMTDEAAKALDSSKNALVAKLKAKVGELRERLTGSEAEHTLMMKGFEKQRRELFKSAQKPPPQYLEMARKRAAAKARAKDADPMEFMAKEETKPTSQDVYNEMLDTAELAILEALEAGKDMGSTSADVFKQLEAEFPENSQYFGQVFDQAGAMVSNGFAAFEQATEATAGTTAGKSKGTAKKRKAKSKKKDPKQAEATDPRVWLDGLLGNIEASIDEVMAEITNLKDKASNIDMAKARKKAMEKLEALAEEEGLTMEQAQALLWQRAKENERTELFAWAESNLEPVQIQEQIEKNSLLEWARVNGMPEADMKIAVAADDMLYELSKWAQENNIDAPTFDGSYQNLEAGLTAETLLGEDPKQPAVLNEAAQRRAKIKAQGRIAYELQQMDQDEEGVSRTLNAILDEVINQPLASNRTILEQLEERIINKGWPEADAKRLAKEISDGYAELIDTRMRRRLQRKFIEKGTRRGKEDRKALENITMAMKTHFLSDKEFLDEFARQYGMKTIGELEESKIAEYGERIEKLIEQTDNPTSRVVRDVQDELHNYISGLVPTNALTLIMTFRKQAMLSGFSTAVTNTISNAFNTALKIESLIIQELIRGNFGNVSIIMRGALMASQGEAWNEAWRILKDKRQQWKSGTKLEVNHDGDPTQSHPLFNKGGYKNPLHWFTHVFAWMQAQDYPFYLTAEGAAAALQTAKEIQAHPELTSEKSLHRAVARKMGWGREFQRHLDQAKSEGFTGKIKKQRAYELRRDSWSEEAQYSGKELGNIATYNVEKVPGILGKFSAAITALKRQGGEAGFIADLLMPFTNIPFSVANAVIENSPLGYIRAIQNKDVVDAATGKTRQVTIEEKVGWTIQATQGSVLMLSGMAMFLAKWREWKDDEDDKDDLPKIRITAFGPADAGDRAKWLAAGNEPYTITVNGNVFSYRAWSGMLGVLGPVGAMMDMLLYGESDDPTRNKGFYYRVAMNSLLAMPQAVLDQTSLMQISDLLDALDSAKAKGAQETTSKINSLVARTVTSVIPNLFKQLDNIWDPSIYPNDTLGAAFIQNVPFASSGRLNKRLNMFGEEIQLSALRQFYQAPVPRKAFRVDPVATWLLANDIPMGPPSYRIHERDPRDGSDLSRSMDSEERYQYLKIWGPMMKEKLKERIDAGYYDNRPKESIKKDVQSWRRGVTRHAMYLYEKKRGDI